MISSIFDLSEKNFISIIGMGGKTTLINLFYNYLHHKESVLIAPSTKILKWEPYLFDKFHIINCENYSIEIDSSKKETLLLGRNINSKKITGASLSCIENYSKYFKHTLCEADGSKGFLLKGWKNNEPVVSKLSTHTIGIISIHCIGLYIVEENIFRLNEFLKLTKSNKYDFVDFEILKKLILNEEGLFKNSFGNLYLLLNQINSLEEFNLAKKFANFLKKEKPNFFKKIIASNLLNSEFLIL